MSVQPFLHQSETLASSQWNFSQAYCNHCRAAAQWLIMFVFKPPSTYISTDPTNQPTTHQSVPIQTRSLLLTTKATLLMDWRAIGPMNPVFLFALSCPSFNHLFFRHTLSTAYLFFWLTLILNSICSVIISMNYCLKQCFEYRPNTSQLDHTVTYQPHPLPSEREPDTSTPFVQRSLYMVHDCSCNFSRAEKAKGDFFTNETTLKIQILP